MRRFDGLANVALPRGLLHLAIGMFDGVHRGHRAVIDAAVRAARDSGGLAAVLTFWPHPSALFRPEDPTRLIQDSATKARVLETLGVDAMITQAFTPDFATIAARDFLPWLQQRLPQLRGVFVGENFRFGRGRAGDAKLLVQTAHRVGLEASAVQRVSSDGEPISSTRIRRALAAGEIERANALLGYTYFTDGPVIAGKRLGRTIGFPTLNLAWSPAAKPKFGVYAVRVAAADGSTPRDAVANYGLRPTVEDSSEPRLEVHVLGDCPFGEGDAIRVEWRRFLRPEAKFAGLDELRAQIARDRDAAAKFFAAA
jgi:riboflavin kinase/FMN adenylyltransferase